jgi:hypothetical protein
MFNTASTAAHYWNGGSTPLVPQSVVGHGGLTPLVPQSVVGHGGSTPLVPQPIIGTEAQHR